MSVWNHLALTIGAPILVGSAPSTPPIVTVHSPDVERAGGLHLARWEAGEIMCSGGISFPGTVIKATIPTRMSYRQTVSEPATFGFTLGSDGRALSIGLAEQGRRASRMADIAPAIASSTFPALETQQQCTVTFTETAVPFDEAELRDLVMLRAHNRNARIPSETWARFAPGDCRVSPRPRALTRSYPDFRTLPRRAGERHWVFLSYDTDAQGHTINTAIRGSSESAALNDEGLRAVQQSQYTNGNRTGCVRYFWTGAGDVEAPSSPPLDSYGTEPDGCDAEAKWAKEPRLTYPNNFRRRAIDGWVVLRYDVAPWGEVGNIEVLEAQPADAFGTAAQKMLSTGRYVEQDAGLKGCITRVMYRLPNRGAQPELDTDD